MRPVYIVEYTVKNFPIQEKLALKYILSVYFIVIEAVTLIGIYKNIDILTEYQQAQSLGKLRKLSIIVKRKLHNVN